jgi:hypothetical protein
MGEVIPFPHREPNSEVSNVVSIADVLARKGMTPKAAPVVPDTPESVDMDCEFDLDDLPCISKAVVWSNGKFVCLHHDRLEPTPA